MKRSIATAMILSLVLTACQGNPFKGSKSSGDDAFADNGLAPAGLLRAPGQRFPDVPLPMHVKEDTDRTYVYENSSLQIGRMVYTVKEAVNDVAQFYIRECPTFGWTLDSTLQAEGIMLVFKRPGKRLIVYVTPTGLVDRSALLILNYTPDDASGVLDNRPIHTSPL